VGCRCRLSNDIKEIGEGNIERKKMRREDVKNGEGPGWIRVFPQDRNDKKTGRGEEEKGGKEKVGQRGKKKKPNFWSREKGQGGGGDRVRMR